ncbi:MAG: hypothetical protein Q8L79_05130 [Methylobacter sp.]|uniref:hypothetical protein n=1 Tax=Methylobacter sp. TaxID=2051955 RepID=UPI0027310418|nr:hypothetical protein [Methylobacter sp.]MDP1664493.1 hypothetical protein [Methylobacter sp.]
MKNKPAMPVDISTEEKLRDYLHESTKNIIGLIESGHLKFKNNNDLEHFTQFLLLVSDLACEGTVNYQRNPGEAIH